MLDNVLVNDRVTANQAARSNNHASEQALQLLGEKATGKAAADTIHAPKLTFEELSRAMGGAGDKAKQKLQDGTGDGGNAVGKILGGCVIEGAAGEALKQGAKTATKAAGKGEGGSTELTKPEEKAGGGELKEMEGSEAGDDEPKIDSDRATKVINDMLKKGSEDLDFDPKKMQNGANGVAGEAAKNKAMNAQKGS